MKAVNGRLVLLANFSAVCIHGRSVVPGSEWWSTADRFMDLMKISTLHNPTQIVCKLFTTIIYLMICLIYFRTFCNYCLTPSLFLNSIFKWLHTCTCTYIYTIIIDNLCCCNSFRHHYHLRHTISYLNVQSVS